MRVPVSPTPGQYPPGFFPSDIPVLLELVLLLLDVFFLPDKGVLVTCLEFGSNRSVILSLSSVVCSLFLASYIGE